MAGALTGRVAVSTGGVCAGRRPVPSPPLAERPTRAVVTIAIPSNATTKEKS
jgi:hypothetical protein